MNEHEITAKLVISALNQIGSMFAATSEELKKIREIFEQHHDINGNQSATDEYVNQSIKKYKDVAQKSPKADKRIPKGRVNRYELCGKTVDCIRACATGNEYYVLISDICSVLGLCETNSTKIYNALEQKHRAKARVSIKGSRTMEVNVALQRPLRQLCKKMGYDISKLQDYFRRGSTKLVVAPHPYRNKS